eukprot:ctg_468.g229
MGGRGRSKGERREGPAFSSILVAPDLSSRGREEPKTAEATTPAAERPARRGVLNCRGGGWSPPGARPLVRNIPRGGGAARVCYVVEAMRQIRNRARNALGAGTDDSKTRPSEQVPAAKKRTRRAPLTELRPNVARSPAALSKGASRESIRFDERLSDKSHDSVAAVSLSTPTSTEEEAVITFQDQPPPFMGQALSFRITSAWSEERVEGDVAATAGEERPSSSHARRPARTPAAAAAGTPRADADASVTASRSSDASARQPRR